MDTNRILFLNQAYMGWSCGGEVVPWGAQAIHEQYLAIVLKQTLLRDVNCMLRELNA